MSQPVLDQAFRVSEANGVNRYRAVTSGSEKGTCQYPDAGSTILGVTTHAQSRAEKSVGVRRLGIILCEASEAISSGSSVIANTEGTIKAAPTAFGSNGSTGANNLLEITSKLPNVLGNLFTITISKGDDGVPSDYSIVGNSVSILAEANGGGTLIATADDIVTFINSHAVLSTLISAANGIGSTGVGLVALSSISLSGGEGGLYSFATAQEAATAAGDLIEIFLH